MSSIGKSVNEGEIYRDLRSCFTVIFLISNTLWLIIYNKKEDDKMLL